MDYNNNLYIFFSYLCQNVYLNKHRYLQNKDKKRNIIWRWRKTSFFYTNYFNYTNIQYQFTKHYHQLDLSGLLACRCLPVIVIQVVAVQPPFEQRFPVAACSDHTSWLTRLLRQEVIGVPSAPRVNEWLAVLCLVVVEPSTLSVITAT